MIGARVRVQRVLEETQEHYHVIQKFIVLGDLDGKIGWGVTCEPSDGLRSLRPLSQVFWRSFLIG